MTRTPVAAHQARVDALLAPLRDVGTETVALGAALGRVTAAEVRSPIDLPPFRNSQMDGFAVRVAELPATLPIVGESAARPGPVAPLAPGTAMRIMTGAPVPDGADAIVPVEEASVADKTQAAGEAVTLPATTTGRYVREAGSDLGAGEVLLPAGVTLASRHLGALAAAGLTEVAVRARVRVAVLSSGSELVAPGEPLGPGRIPDANGVALEAAARAAGAEVVHRARVADDPELLRVELDAAVAAGARLVITSGGISMGDHEVVRELLEPLGATVDVLAMQPGGPQALAAWDGVPVLCFPGNPVSSQLSFEIFAAPTLRAIAGIPAPRRGPGTLGADLESVAGRRQFLRGRRRDDSTVVTVAGPGSHLVAALAAAEVLIVVPEETVRLVAGETVEVWEL
jgi:molybdopterin molybdotransferase